MLLKVLLSLLVSVEPNTTEVGENQRTILQIGQQSIPLIGPQTLEDIAKARTGLQGEHSGGDMLYKDPSGLVLSLLAFVEPPTTEVRESQRPIPQIGQQSIPQIGPQTPEDIAKARAGLQKEHYGGDMLYKEGEAHPSGDGINDERYRWLNYPGSGVVPYTIDASLNDLRGIIQEAMEEYHRKTCIRFVPKNSSNRDWIDLRYGQGCNSYVGRQGGRQIVNLGDGCWFKGTVIHELGHAIGMHHEHQRSDRDQYIYVYKENVIKQFVFAFNKVNRTEEILLTPYDYDSIMHYGNYAFSVEPNRLPTMAAYNGKQLLEPYHKTGFTPLDVQAVKKLYKCRW